MSQNAESRRNEEMKKFFEGESEDEFSDEVEDFMFGAEGDKWLQEAHKQGLWEKKVMEPDRARLRCLWLRHTANGRSKCQRCMEEDNYKTFKK